MPANSFCRMITICLLSEFTELQDVLLLKVIDTSCVCLHFYSKVILFSIRISCFFRYWDLLERLTYILEAINN